MILRPFLKTKIGDGGSRAAATAAPRNTRIYIISISIYNIFINIYSIFTLIYNMFTSIYNIIIIILILSFPGLILQFESVTQSGRHSGR